MRANEFRAPGVVNGGQLVSSTVDTIWVGAGPIS